MNRHPMERQRTNRWNFALYIGVFAGLIWGGLKIIEYYFHFTTLPIGFLIEPFFLHSYVNTWQGMVTGWLAFILFSVVASLLYSVMLSQAKSAWIGIGYGAVWWGIIFLLIGPVTGMMNWIAFIDLNTILSDFCLFVLWGLFIGYSISFEFTDHRVSEPLKNASSEPERA
ncbi:YqhR family membrane protein [Paenibacillus cremeus]|uniref:Membrane protein YqhR n=1 Tax=Paenibacillus cremeus TaxID=2163881 RepID=A0A559KH65_9BACL|nr:YqhR family membrane protein [Paenibacillus cremeus]TVY11475.1 hypothetical protein FPZ49_01895 [Paenibacillus cremeus]